MKLSLPEPNIYSLEKLSQEWGCSALDLVEQGAQHRLLVTTRLTQATGNYCKDGTIVESNQCTSGLFFVHYYDLENIYHNGETKVKEVISKYKSKSKIFPYPSAVSSHRETLRLWPLITLTIKDLLITKEEKDRFEAKYGSIEAISAPVISPSTIKHPPDPQANGIVEKRLSVLHGFIEEAEKRAADKGFDFDRSKITTTRATMLKCLQQMEPGIFAIAQDTFNDYMKEKKICGFRQGRPSRDSIIELFPEYFQN